LLISVCLCKKLQKSRYLASYHRVYGTDLHQIISIGRDEYADIAMRFALRSLYTMQYERNAKNAMVTKLRFGIMAKNNL